MWCPNFFGLPLLCLQYLLGEAFLVGMVVLLGKGSGRFEKLCLCAADWEQVELAHF